MGKSKWILRGLLGAMLISTAMSGAVLAETGDLNGSQDHPLISRFKGSTIFAYTVRNFDEYTLPLSKLENDKLAQSQKLEGKVTQITYSSPKDRSILEIYRNYEKALKKAGFKILFSGKNQDLGQAWLKYFVNATPRVTYYGVPDLGTRLGGGDYYYLNACLSRPAGDVYASLCVATGWYQTWPVTHLDVIEVKPMETDMVTVDAKALAKDLDQTGHVAVYGIYFDTGKADVKPESAPTLKEIAKLMEQNPALKLYVVGHTDNVGALAANMELSLNRAKAVNEILVKDHRVTAARLEAHGVGPLAPVASNTAEAGRAKNRRVELVGQ